MAQWPKIEDYERRTAKTIARDEQADQYYLAMENEIVLMLAQGEFIEALNAAHHLVRYRPEQASAWRMLAKCHKASGELRGEFAAQSTACKILEELLKQGLLDEDRKRGLLTAKIELADAAKRLLAASE